jgi:hypothetical protein
MARGRGICRSHQAEFSFIVVVVTVIGIVDEVDRDDSRLHSQEFGTTDFVHETGG